MFQTVFLRNSFIIIAVFIIFSCKEQEKPLPYYNTPDFTPIFIESSKEAENKVTHSIADFSFTDQSGIAITQKTIENKIHVANFFYTSCGIICPVTMGNVAKVNTAFKKDSGVVFLSYSVTPWIDSVETLKSYASTRNFNSGNWHLLTGKKSQIYDLARKSYFAEEEIGFSKDSADFLHTEHFILVDKNKHIRGIYNGTLELDVQQLIEDIKVLKVE